MDGIIYTLRNGDYNLIVECLDDLKSDRETGQILSVVAGEEQPDLYGLLMEGHTHDFLFGEETRGVLTTDVVNQLRAFLDMYLDARGLTHDQPLVESYSNNCGILFEYFSGMNNYISNASWRQLLTVRARTPGCANTPCDVLVVCTGTRDGDLTMQGIVACPFFSAKYQGLGHLVLKHMNLRTTEDKVNLRVDPHSRSRRWRALLAKQSFVRNVRGGILDPG